MPRRQRRPTVVGLLERIVTSTPNTLRTLAVIIVLAVPAIAGLWIVRAESQPFRLSTNARVCGHDSAKASALTAVPCRAESLKPCSAPGKC